MKSIDWRYTSNVLYPLPPALFSRPFRAFSRLSRALFVSFRALISFALISPALFPRLFVLLHVSCSYFLCRSLSFRALFASFRALFASFRSLISIALISPALFSRLCVLFVPLDKTISGGRLCVHSMKSLSGNTLYRFTGAG